LQNRISTQQIAQRKGKQPLVCLTAYSKPMAEYLDKHVDLLLVGDSLGMVLYGFTSTRDVTLDMMINHGKAVMRGSQHACVIIDLPYGTYEYSPDQALQTAKQVINETGASGVKLEGGEKMAATVKHIVDNGIPVFGHIGLLPQHVTAKDDFRVQGRDIDAQHQVINDAKAIDKAGAFAIVIEGTVEDTATQASRAISVPSIGIGASALCDGQILVSDDMLGIFSGFKPKFVKRYADLKSQIENAVSVYAKDVKQRQFPGPEHLYRRTRP